MRGRELSRGVGTSRITPSETAREASRRQRREISCYLVTPFDQKSSHETGFCEIESDLINLMTPRDTFMTPHETTPSACITLG